MYSRNKTKSKSKKSSKIESKITINASSNINNLINYKNIFSHNRKIDKSIIFLKKTEFDIFYSCRYKYPILVKETITSQTGNPGLNENRIDRSKIDDPFEEDILIPQQYRHSIDDYKKYMQFGVSMGHNAAAGQHKTNMKVYSETFLLSNITPQEMVLNSGLWALMENWCKKLGDNKSLYNITVFTGSIVNKSNTNIKDVDIKMNIPLKMFKIICFNHINKPKTTFMEIFIVNNAPYYINPKTVNYDLSQYLIPIKSWTWFENFSGINLNNLLEFYNLNLKYIKPFRKIIKIEIYIYRLLQQLMKKSNWYGFLIYASNINELEKKWKECQLYENEFGDLKYHREFYELVKAKLIRESTSHENVILFKPVTNIIKLNSFINTNTKSKINFNSKIKSKNQKYTKKNRK